MIRSASNQVDAQISYPSVAIVLCTYQGERFIAAQIESLIAQTWPVSIFVFDDGSSDRTVERVSALLRAGKDHLIARDENHGYVRNFESGICHVLDQGFQYVALCDQDDVWRSERIELGMKLLLAEEENQSDGVPLLVHSDLLVIDEHDDVLHDSYFSFRNYKPATHRSLPIVLGQNGVMGNTVLMNASLARLALPFPQYLHVHDYWLSLVAELWGERKLIMKPLVRYRIHDTNVSNSRLKLSAGAQPGTKRSGWNRVVSLDLRLPYREDSRQKVLEDLLDSSDDRRSLTDNQRHLINVFQDYLLVRKRRIHSATDMLRLGFIKPGLFHRLRFFIVQLITQRYG